MTGTRTKYKDKIGVATYCQGSFLPVLIPQPALYAQVPDRMNHSSPKQKIKKTLGATVVAKDRLFSFSAHRNV